MQLTYQKNGFLFFKEQAGPDSILGDRLIIEEGKIDAAINYINKNGIKSITINSALSNVRDLDFLKHIPLLEGLYLLQNEVDAHCINGLNKLRVLRIGNIKGVLDFSNFRDLEVLSFSYSKNVKNISLCNNLFWLWMDGYKKEDLCELKELINLQYLTLLASSINNLHGIEHMEKLILIRLDTVRNLRSLKGLSSALHSLEVLYIYAAKNLNEYDEIVKVKSLRQLELRKTGECKSISFIQELPQLKKVTLGLKVLDGNMGYLKGIEKVGFIDYPHYTLKMKDFS